MKEQGKVVGVNISSKKGTGKVNIGSGYLEVDYGLRGDAHAGTERQVSLFMVEKAKALARKLNVPVNPGDLAENITVEGINLEGVKPGTRLLIGEAVVEIIRIGKNIDNLEDHAFSFHGHAPLMMEGIYCRVIKSGKVKVGDIVTVIEYC